MFDYRKVNGKEWPCQQQKWTPGGFKKLTSKNVDMIAINRKWFGTHE
jgi:hypothetical protein